jgi:hypothetical protein
MVSPKPPSVFVPDVTLIALLNPVAIQRALGRTFSSRESLFVSRQENGLVADIESQSRRKPEFALASSLRRFRRLFAAAQSTTPSKLASPLIDRGFLVLRLTRPTGVKVCPR